jgi:hypothetical protein
MIVMRLWLRWQARKNRLPAAEADARRVLGVPMAYPERVVTTYRERYFEELQAELWPHDTDSFFINLF